ncbi:MAG: hypothetical protein AAF293_10890 [Pseudomonadota bacterium]
MFLKPKFVNLIEEQDPAVRLTPEARPLRTGLPGVTAPLTNSVGMAALPRNVAQFT